MLSEELRHSAGQTFSYKIRTVSRMLTTFTNPSSSTSKSRCEFVPVGKAKTMEVGNEILYWHSLRLHFTFALHSHLSVKLALNHSLVALLD